MLLKKANIVFFAFFFVIIVCSCSTETETGYRRELLNLLENTSLEEESRFSVINQISQGMLGNNETDELILFLTDYVNQNPDDKYNAYWLLLTAYTYQKQAPMQLRPYIFKGY